MNKEVVYFFYGRLELLQNLVLNMERRIIKKT